MSEDTCCGFCRAKLDIEREFAYWFEVAGGRLDPDASAWGPLRMCRDCHQEIESNRQAMEEQRQLEEADHARARRIWKVAVTGMLLMFATVYVLTRLLNDD